MMPLGYLSDNFSLYPASDSWHLSLGWGLHSVCTDRMAASSLFLPFWWRLPHKSSRASSKNPASIQNLTSLLQVNIRVECWGNNKHTIDIEPPIKDHRI